MALDCFYEVFNEDYFDAVLFETGAIQMMKIGYSALKAMFKQLESDSHSNIKNKEYFNEQEFAIIENSLENVIPFIQYKK